MMMVMTIIENKCAEHRITYNNENNNNRCAKRIMYKNENNNENNNNRCAKHCIYLLYVQ